MQEIRGNLFDPSSYRLEGKPVTWLPDAICITTNGFVKANGQAVMGRGCAKQATQMYPGISTVLGNVIKSNGNVTQPLLTLNDELGWGRVIVAYPVKGISALCDTNKANIVNHMKPQFKVGQRAPGWALKADIQLIMKSAYELKQLAEGYGWQKVVLPRPGCGAGELYWNDVGRKLEAHLSDNFFSITF